MITVPLGTVLDTSTPHVFTPVVGTFGVGVAVGGGVEAGGGVAVEPVVAGDGVAVGDGVAADPAVAVPDGGPAVAEARFGGAEGKIPEPSGPDEAGTTDGVPSMRAGEGEKVTSTGVSA